MSNLDQQLLLFEREVLSLANEHSERRNTEKSDFDASNRLPNIPVKSTTPRMTFSGPTIDLQQGKFLPPPPGPINNLKFLPHQLRQSHPLANFMRPPIAIPTLSAVIESGPELYKSSHGQRPSKEESSAKKAPQIAQIPQIIAKTLALPSDVELLAAKRQSSKAHQNSYLGQVLRGEKKMKRFMRSCGGQTWEDASLAEWDPNDFRVFCGDLGNEVSDELLAKAFRKYPSFQKAKVVRDSRTNKSKGYGFVSFKNQEDFIRAVKEMDGKYVGNRPIKLRKSKWKERSLDMVKRKTKENKRLGLT